MWSLYGINYFFTSHFEYGIVWIHFMAFVLLTYGFRCRHFKCTFDTCLMRFAADKWYQFIVVLTGRRKHSMPYVNIGRYSMIRNWLKSITLKKNVGSLIHKHEHRYCVDCMLYSVHSKYGTWDWWQDANIRSWRITNATEKQIRTN